MSTLKRAVRATGLRRTHLAAVRLRVERTGIAALRRQGTRRARILSYHSVGTPSWGVNDVPPPRFERHLELAHEHGYRFVAAEAIAAGEGAPGDLAITFDDGLRTVATNAAPLLAARGIPWSLFVVTEWASGRHDDGLRDMLGWDELRGLAQMPLATIGSHSVSHPQFSLLSPHDARRELVDSRSILEQELQTTVDTFAIPLGQSGDWRDEHTDVAREAGYRVVYAQSESKRPAGTVARTFVTRYDNDRIFLAALGGAFDRWEEWV